MADRLRQAGYRSALFGKWHLGSSERFLPLERGFDEFFGFLAGQHSFMNPAPQGANPVLDGREPVNEMAYLADELAERAVDFIRRHKAQPFFLYLAFNAVHLPMEATSEYLARFTHISDEQRRTYAAMLSAMDRAGSACLSSSVGRDAWRRGEPTHVRLFSSTFSPLRWPRREYRCNRHGDSMA